MELLLITIALLSITVLGITCWKLNKRVNTHESSLENSDANKFYLDHAWISELESKRDANGTPKHSFNKGDE